MSQNQKDLFFKQTVQARLLLLNTAKRVGGSHIGGSFSSMDFFICLFGFLKSHGIVFDRQSQSLIGEAFNLNFQTEFTFVMSKGHCYLAMLCALDIVFETDYSSEYLTKGTILFGHPKRLDNSNLFSVSSGSLGQGVVFANGIAFEKKLNQKPGLVVTLCGDGELNEGSVTEAIAFCGQHSLSHVIFIDNNNQMSLDKTSNIQSNANVSERFTSLVEKASTIDGHNFEELESAFQTMFTKNWSSLLYDLTTIKGKGVSFMEGETKWHHRRFKFNEFEDALTELKNALAKGC